MVEVAEHLSLMIFLIFLQCFVSILLFNVKGGAHCIEEKRVLSLEEEKPKWEQIKPPQKCLPQRSRREKGTTILELRHHSYCSEPNLSKEHKIRNLLLSDSARVASFQNRIENSGFGSSQEQQSEARMPLMSGAKLQTLNYVVTVELGGEKLTVIADTGSDLTWIQCEPCALCYNQQDPLFDPSASPSFRTIPCNSSICFSLQSSTCGSDEPNCNYALSYGDGSYSRGVLSQDGINLAGNVIQGFVFGCGRSNSGLFGGTSGLMGLGRAQLSLISQTSTQFGGVFSYCLPIKEYDSSGSLVLGNDSSVYRNSTPIVYTTMISDTLQVPSYFLNLTGMTIGGVEIQASGFTNIKVLVDSGTVITRLVPSLYDAVKAEFSKQFSGYPLGPGFSILDTCFNLSGYNEVKVPTIRFEFEGDVNVEVDTSGVLYFVKNDASQVCLALAALDNEYQVGIIGNYQQKNLRVVYDTIGGRIGFAEEICDYS